MHLFTVIAYPQYICDHLICSSVVTTMARAFLSLSTELTEAFSSAQDDLQVRALVLNIEEEAITLKSVQNIVGDCAADFDILRDSLSGTCIVFTNSSV
jgi:hypothetical protein